MQNYFDYICPLFLGLLFATIGIGIFRAAWRDRRVFESLFALPFVAGGSLAVWMMITSPLPWQRSHMANVLFHSSPRQVTSIEIYPSSYPAQPQLTKAPIRITDHANIEKICQGLASAEPHSLNHPTSIWNCILVITVEEESIRCEVSDTSNNGLTIRIVSGDAVTTYCGTYQADALAEILPEVVKSAVPLEAK